MIALVLLLNYSYTLQVLEETLRTAAVGTWAARVYEYDLQVGEYTILAEVRSHGWLRDTCGQRKSLASLSYIIF